MSSELRLAKRIVRVLETRALAGCKHPNWKGFENGNGSEVGGEIDALIKAAQRIIDNQKQTLIKP